ncbi:YtxH domain-containing protein [Clostridium sp.]|uniref:YtxH domain-containing protein n=1 Tax=Clostridium sp. TaxID=1506 RepID=UPI003D6D363A
MILTDYFKKRKKEKQRILKIKTAKKVLVGTAAGSLSGLLGGLLFSPKSGKENRKAIVNTSKDITNNVKEKSIELKESIDNKVSDTKDNVIDAKSKIKEKSAQLKETIDNKVSGAKENVTDAKVKISEYLNEKRGSKVANETNDVVNATDSEDAIDIVVQADLTEKKAKK